MKKYLIFIAIAFFVLILLIVVSSNNNIVIEKVDPSPNSEKISIFPNVLVYFSRKLTKNDFDHIKIDVAPKANHKVLFRKNILEISFNSNLESQTKYTVSVSYYDKKYSWSFKTVSNSGISPQDESKAQSLLDNEYKSEVEMFNKKYPWYNKLPSDNGRYFIGFDASSNTFFVDIYVNSNTKDVYVESLKQEVYKELKKIGVRVENFVFSWNTTKK